MANTTIDQLPSLTSANITDRTKVHILVDDTQGTATTKQLLLSELDDLWSSDAGSVRVYSATHGLSSGDAGKPIGWKADGKPYVHTDTASTELPVAVFVQAVDTDYMDIIPAGGYVEVASSLFPGSMPVNGGDSNSRTLYWDASAATYVHDKPSDSAFPVQIIYWIGTKEGDTSTAQCVVMPWAEDPVTESKLMKYAETAVPTTGAEIGLHSVQTGANAGLYFWTGAEAVLITAYSEDGDWPVS